MGGAFWQAVDSGNQLADATKAISFAGDGLLSLVVATAYRLSCLAGEYASVESCSWPHVSGAVLSARVYVGIHSHRHIPNMALAEIYDVGTYL